MPYTSSIVGAYIGNAAGGKSLSLAATCVWQMLAGRKVWSNMKVKTSPAILSRKKFIDGSDITYKETEALDWNLFYMLDDSMVNGTIAFDEIGYFADSRQSASTKNKLMNAVMRQVRHRNLNIFYTALDFGMVDYRLRYETSFVCTCEDMMFKPWGKENNVEGGICILQRYYDVSGRMTGKRQDYYDTRKTPYRVRRFRGRPYWDCYDTREIISLEEAFTGVELDLQKRRISNRANDDGVQDKVMECLGELAINNDEVPGDMLWSYLRSKGIEGVPATLGRYIPKTVKRKYSKSEGQLYDLSKL